MRAHRHILRNLDRAVFEEDPPDSDQFGRVLLTTVVALVVLSLVDLRPHTEGAGSDLGAIVVTLALGLLVVLVTQASGVRRRWRRLVIVFALSALAASVILLLRDLLSDTPEGADPGSVSASPFWLVLVIGMPVLVVRRILHHKRVEVSTLAAAISAYLMIALSFTFAFLSVDAAQSQDFFGDPQASTAYMYFSLTSITTLGYGDLTAVTSLGRLLATTEAVVGQIFLVTLVAALVGQFTRKGRQAGSEQG